MSLYRYVLQLAARMADIIGCHALAQRGKNV